MTSVWVSKQVKNNQKLSPLQISLLERIHLLSWGHVSDSDTFEMTVFFRFPLKVFLVTNRDCVQNDRKFFSFRLVKWFSEKIILWLRYGSPNMQKTVENSKYGDMARVWGYSVVCSSGYPHPQIFFWMIYNVIDRLWKS